MTQIPDEIFSEEEEYYSFGDELYDALSPCIKRFLTDYYGKAFYNFDAETYRSIESIISEELKLYGNNIPDILYRYRTITDEDKWEEALEKFERKITRFTWPENEKWYHRDFTGEDNNDDDIFLDGISESELTNDEKKAKNIVDVANNMMDYTTSFADFMKKGCGDFIISIQTFIEDTCSFDLSILSSEGFKELQKDFDMMAEIIFEDLFGLLNP